MKARLSIAVCTLALVLSNLSFQNVVLGQGGTVEAISDLALQSGGVLNGRVISVQGTPLANTEVAIFRMGQYVASERTKADGKVQFSGLRPGVHDVVTAGGRKQYRLWAPGTAPPVALAAAQIIDESNQPEVTLPEQEVAAPQQKVTRRPSTGRWLTRGRLIGMGVGVGVIGGTIAIIEHNNSSPGS